MRKYRAVRSSRQCCETCKVKVLAPSIACSRAASISNAREGNDARSAWMKTPQLPCRETCSGRNDEGGKQTRRPEHNEIAAASKRYPWKVVFAERSGKPTHFTAREGRWRWGRTRQMHLAGPPWQGLRHLRKASQNIVGKVPSAAEADGNLQRLL